MKAIKGPGIYLAQFMRDEKPFDNVIDIAKWLGGLGYKGIQAQIWDTRVFDLDKASESKGYCDDLNGRLRESGMEIVELGGASHGAGRGGSSRVRNPVPILLPKRAFRSRENRVGPPDNCGRRSGRRSISARKTSRSCPAASPGTCSIPGLKGRKASSTRPSRS